MIYPNILCNENYSFRFHSSYILCLTNIIPYISLLIFRRMRISTVDVLDELRSLVLGRVCIFVIVDIFSFEISRFHKYIALFSNWFHRSKSKSWIDQFFYYPVSSIFTILMILFFLRSRDFFISYGTYYFCCWPNWQYFGVGRIYSYICWCYLKGQIIRIFRQICWRFLDIFIVQTKFQSEPIKYLNDSCDNFFRH